MNRFGGVERIYQEHFPILTQAHVLVVGLGGVGSWTVEALVRTGIGELTLLDGDDICASNTNRQIHTTTEVVGRPKAEVLAERCLAINPDCRVNVVPEFFSVESRDRHLAHDYDYVVDAVDGVTAKIWLLASCRERGIPVVTTGGAGARKDPSRVRVADLSVTSGDRLLAFVRKKLRGKLGFPPPGTVFGIPCVYSDEPPILDERCEAVPANSAGDSDVLEAATGGMNCEGGLGSLSFVTGTFGFFAAAQVINDLVQGATPAQKMP